jgi:hypothetical protein
MIMKNFLQWSVHYWSETLLDAISQQQSFNIETLRPERLCDHNLTSLL